MVIDFIGNHRSFLTKPQSLLFLLGEDLPPHVAIEQLREKTLELPEGCSIEIELDALDLLSSMVRVSQEDTALYEYLSFRDTHGRRPSAAELFAEGVSFGAIRDRYVSWFHFVARSPSTTAKRPTRDISISAACSKNAPMKFSAYSPRPATRTS